MKCRRCGEEVEDFDNHPVYCKPLPSSSRPPLPQSSSEPASDEARSVSSKQATGCKYAITLAMEHLRDAERDRLQRIQDRKAAEKGLRDYLLTPGNKDAMITAFNNEITSFKEAETTAQEECHIRSRFLEGLLAKQQEQELQASSSQHEESTRRVENTAKLTTKSIKSLGEDSSPGESSETSVSEWIRTLPDTSLNPPPVLPHT